MQEVVLTTLAFDWLLITLKPLLDDSTFPLRQRLFLYFRGCTFYGREVFSLISGKPGCIGEILTRHQDHF